MGNSASVSSSNWTSTYLVLKNKHDCAYQLVDEAISLEEEEKPFEAIEKYKESIQIIDELLRVSVQQPENPEGTWQKACDMIQKIKKTRAEILTRINCIKSSFPQFDGAIERPPSYEEATTMSSNSSSSGYNNESRGITYKDLAAALQELNVEPNIKLNEELVYSHPGVRLYFISPTGEVLSASEPQLLRISLIEGTEPNTPRAILKIGDWIYPLVPGVSPCYRTGYGAFIVPDLYSNIPGSSVGIILPQTADADVFDLLENILHGVVTQETEQEIFEEKERRRLQPHEEDNNRSEWISQKIVNGACSLSEGIIKGAQKAGELLNRNTPKLIDNLAPADQPTEVPSSVTKGVKIAENATSKAVQVTGYVAEKVGEGTVRLGQFMAPHIHKQGTKLLASGFHMSENDASSRMKSILTVAAGAVEGFSTIYRGLETSAGILGSSLKDNTVKVVEHKWGPHCANATESSLSTVGNVYSTYENAKVLKPQRLLKSTAKGAVHSNTQIKGKEPLYGSIIEAGPSRVDFKKSAIENVLPEKNPRMEFSEEPKNLAKNNDKKSFESDNDDDSDEDEGKPDEK